MRRPVGQSDRQAQIGDTGILDEELGILDQELGILDQALRYRRD
jgi:hypothetical protein